MASAREIRDACRQIAASAVITGDPDAELIANLAHRLGQLAEHVRALEERCCAGASPPSNPGKSDGLRPQR